MKKQNKNTLALWLFLILVLALVVKYMSPQDHRMKTIQFQEFMTLVKDGQVAQVTIKAGKNPQEIIGKFKSGVKTGLEESFSDVSYFKTYGNISDHYLTQLEKYNIIPNWEKGDEQSLFSTLLINWGPLIFLIIIFYFFLRQIQGAGGKAMSFGKSKAKMLSPSEKKVTFKDVSGVDEAKEELVEVVDFLKDPKKYTALGGKIPKGVILVGPPGTGKTLLARAVAGEADVPFFSISGSDFVEMFVGVGASRVRDLFEQGKKNAPCIIFVDEIDAVGRHRGAGLGGGHDEREQTLNQLLVEMDGFESNEGVILIAATNRIDVLDPALLRPGRFDRRVTVGRPDVRGRLGILKVHTGKTPLDKAVDLESIAKGTPGFTGADLANLVNEAALLAARANKKLIENRDFEDAKDKVLMGVERRSMVISDEDKRKTAYHEAGHTLVGLKLPKTDPIHKVSIIPRGGALGVTQTLPDEDMLNWTKEKAENFIAFAMGGRVAEEIIYDEISNGAANDIEKATELARNMVCHWGMSEEMGPIAFGKNQTNPFYGMNQGEQEFSEATSQKIDAEVSKIVKGNYELATKILKDNKDKLDALAEALIIWETLDSAQIKKIMQGEDIGAPSLKTPPSDGEGEAPKEEVAEKKTSSDEDPSGTLSDPSPA